ncbi:glycoside hydrolase family 32 protein [Spirilliplanes yamanashiensis]|uniref:beta-fructofuranosidase n=1 Tax=Spirilliplanes yamanashiensis TaxID=42233 RepID=A0A8J4DLT8_9ACTN|nr:glycoside hydrolase family 32 protein [Spirilliplanes yamanashiensis]MDP9818990.1 beta-fructofuranosidase [Spirilliplanes yamanashiensis]GIJ05445.1 hypothetical protein Sya03_47970 [Spirilliplanes yamanashiensis]
MRPLLHFTPRTGWINDPHGVVHADGRYHLFFQHNPAGSVWAEAIHWGHAVSDDLLTWEELPVALSPDGGEAGCWSGSLVLDGGEPVLFYTRVRQPDWAVGQVAVARGSKDLETWRREPVDAVVPGPPPELGVTAFRDPAVWRAGDGWRMLVGASLAGVDGAALQYSSDDLLGWRFDGVVAQRPTTAREGTRTGAMWECPHLFELDGSWVLLFSVWADETLHHVAYGVGDYDGVAFTARSWHRFGHGEQMYATTTFLDADGRRCVLSWLREHADAAPGDRAGAHSLPWVLRLDGDTLVATPHPNLCGEPAPPAGALGPAAQVVLAADGPATVTRGALTLTTDPAAGTVTVAEGGAPRLTMPWGPRVRLIVDADIVEVAVDGVAGVGSTRCAPEPDAPLAVEGGTVAVTRY